MVNIVLAQDWNARVQIQNPRHLVRRETVRGMDEDWWFMLLGTWYM
jgi:hypothetical protein